MEKQKRYDNAYMKMALEWAKLSHCKRKQVGALIVKNRMIISDGYNVPLPDLIIAVRIRKDRRIGMYCMQKQTPF